MKVRCLKGNFLKPDREDYLMQSGVVTLEVLLFAGSAETSYQIYGARG